MASRMDDDLAENYRLVKESRGWSWEQMAAYHDGAGQADIAAFCREQIPAKRGKPGTERAIASKPETR